jgi:hypothetical protein
VVAKIKDIFPTQFQRKQEEKWGRSGRQISTKKMLHRSTGKEVMRKSDTHARKGKQENSCIGLPENKSETSGDKCQNHALQGTQVCNDKFKRAWPKMPAAH